MRAGLVLRRRELTNHRHHLAHCRVMIEQSRNLTLGIQHIDVGRVIELVSHGFLTQHARLDARLEQPLGRVRLFAGAGQDDDLLIKLLAPLCQRETPHLWAGCRDVIARMTALMSSAVSAAIAGTTRHAVSCSTGHVIKARRIDVDKHRPR